jgi:hypothetical protein
MRLAIVETVNTGLSPDALVLVDISPRWLYGHTLADQPVDPAFGAWVDALTRLTRRLHAVARFFDATQPSFPIVTVEQEHLTWLRAPRQAMTLALAGLYGDQCVMAAAETLALAGLYGDQCVMAAAETLALAGLYGDQCVMAAAETLARRGHTFVVVRDLCVWEDDPPTHYPATVLSAENVFPGIGAWMVKQDFAPPLHWDGQPLYTWK